MASLDSGLLYERIMAVPGLTGTWKQRLAQYYNALTGKNYTGSSGEGNYMLNQIKARNFPQAQQAQTITPTATPVVNPATTAVQEVVPQTAWTQVMPWEQYFDPNLAKSAIAQRTANYYNPQIQESQESLESEYAGRGLARSGARSKSLLDTYRDLAEQEATMREQLYSTREKEAREAYGTQQELYEESPKDYKATPYETKKYEYEYPEESPQRYAKSYRSWLKNIYNI